MRSEQREFGFRMVEAIHVRPGPHVMAGFASLRCAVGTAPRHAFFEFAMMDIFMAGGAGPVLNGRASCRGRGENSGGAGLLKKKKKKEYNWRYRDNTLQYKHKKLTRHYPELNSDFQGLY